MKVNWDRAKNHWDWKSFKFTKPELEILWDESNETLGKNECRFHNHYEIWIYKQKIKLEKYMQDEYKKGRVWFLNQNNTLNRTR